MTATEQLPGRMLVLLGDETLQAPQQTLLRYHVLAGARIHTAQGDQVEPETSAACE
jgi:hypothetical protein